MMDWIIFGIVVAWLAAVSWSDLRKGEVPHSAWVVIPLVFAGTYRVWQGSWQLWGLGRWGGADAVSAIALSLVWPGTEFFLAFFGCHAVVAFGLMAFTYKFENNLLNSSIKIKKQNTHLKGIADQASQAKFDNFEQKNTSMRRVKIRILWANPFNSQPSVGQQSVAYCDAMSLSPACPHLVRFFYLKILLNADATRYQ